MVDKAGQDLVDDLRHATRRLVGAVVDDHPRPTVLGVGVEPDQQAGFAQTVLDGAEACRWYVDTSHSGRWRDDADRIGPQRREREQHGLI